MSRAAIDLLAASIAGLVFHWLVTLELPIAVLHRQLKRDVNRLLAAKRERRG
jgi:hypothetical protein